MRDSVERSASRCYLDYMQTVPRPPRGRLAVIAAFAVLAACTREAEAPTPSPAPPAPLPAAPPPPLDRAGLLAAVDAASDAAAAGRPAPELVTALAGRTFEIGLPLGCFGAEAEDATSPAALGYAYDPEARVLRVRAKPEVWTETPWVRALIPAADVEALEGFWVSRPWLRGADCPVGGVALDAPPAPETLGIVQVFSAEQPRTARRDGRAYEAVRKLPEDQAPERAGYRLVLSGRVLDPADGPPVRCSVVHPDRRPICLVLADVQRVALSTPQGEVLAEWTR
jgi:hypothetical protein